MIVHSSEEFRNHMLHELEFIPVESTHHHTLYTNSYHGEYHLYHKRGCYEFGIADYTILHDFKLGFSNSSRLLRFGIVYTGTTTFQLEKDAVSSFSPSSFLVLEDHLSGKQAWKRGQHFHGIEITLYYEYFASVVEQLTGKTLDDSLLPINYTYHYLPLELIQTLQQMRSLSDTGRLSPIYLESKLLECIAILYHEIFQSNENAFAIQHFSEEVKVGQRTLRLSPADLDCIHKAHQILTENATNPPTIEHLSQMVLLNPQKLKAGFLHHYHMTIGFYTTSLRMSAAATLLCTTNMHIQEIAEQVGYNHSANFIKMFKRYYKMTPHQYRSAHLKKSPTLS